MSDTKHKIIIAVDGFSSCGKSTFAKAIARRLGYIFIDTGAMYRAVTLYALEHGAIRSGIVDEDAVVRLLDQITITFRFNPERGASDIYVNGDLAEGKIRTIEVSNCVSRVSAIPAVRRKLVEIYRALEFEKTHTKPQIMELYLNIIPLGENCRGVQSASRVYFGKDVKDLTLAECASLIGITNNPSRYDPYISAENNKERQEIILSEMLKQGYINQAQYDEAVAQELVFTNASREKKKSDDNYSWFVDQVINDVVNDLCDKTGYEYDIVYTMVKTGGYQIYSTVNPDVQAAVDQVYEDLSSLPATASSQQLQSGIVIVDNTTGDIVALAGGVGKKQGSLVWNCATRSLLSPGSIIKPVAVYAPAIELGLITPATVMDDTPYSFTDTATWPKNLDSTYRGLVSVEEAVEQSINTVPVKLVAQMTPEYSYSFAKDKMGLSTLVSSYKTTNGEELSDVNLWALALGSLTRGVTVRAMTAAYAAFANEGVWREARTYTIVKDSNGQVILDNTQESHVAMKDMTAWYITDMLKSTVEKGTGTAAQLENMTVAGKTGTTSRDFDRWFAGYTPEADLDGTVLLIEWPYDEIYRWYLEMKIDDANGEMTKYNNSAAKYNMYYQAYQNAYNRAHLPKSEAAYIKL